MTRSVQDCLKDFQAAVHKTILTHPDLASLTTEDGLNLSVDGKARVLSNSEVVQAMDSIRKSIQEVAQACLDEWPNGAEEGESKQDYAIRIVAKAIGAQGASIQEKISMIPATKKWLDDYKALREAGKDPADIPKWEVTYLVLPFGVDKDDPDVIAVQAEIKDFVLKKREREAQNRMVDW